MILYELTKTEGNDIYQELESRNLDRQLDFLESVVTAALKVQRPFLSQTLIKALNFHAIACLHVNAGEYRPCAVKVGKHTPPEHYRVSTLMDDFVNTVNWQWENANPISLSAFVLWQLNYIHPFINGNGRTACACCYFVLCVKFGEWIRGRTILPELLKLNRKEYISALKQADADNLNPLCDLIGKLLNKQISTS